MKIGTIVKLGSLAFNVAQDEKVQALVKMAHKGAKRRGLLTPPSVSPVHPMQRASARPPRPW